MAVTAGHACGVVTTATTTPGKPYSVRSTTTARARSSALGTPRTGARSQGPGLGWSGQCGNGLVQHSAAGSTRPSRTGRPVPGWRADSPSGRGRLDQIFLMVMGPPGAGSAAAIGRCSSRRTTSRWSPRPPTRAAAVAAGRPKHRPDIRPPHGHPKMPVLNGLEDTRQIASADERLEEGRAGSWILTLSGSRVHLRALREGWRRDSWAKDPGAGRAAAGR